MPKTSNSKTERVHLSLTPELMRRVDEECAKCGESRSVFARRALLNYLDGRDAMRYMPEMIRLVQEAQAMKRQGDGFSQISLADLSSKTAL